MSAAKFTTDQLREAAEYFLETELLGNSVEQEDAEGLVALLLQVEFDLESSKGIKAAAMELVKFFQGSVNEMDQALETKIISNAMKLAATNVADQVNKFDELAKSRLDGVPMFIIWIRYETFIKHRIEGRRTNRWGATTVDAQGRTELPANRPRI